MTYLPPGDIAAADLEAAISRLSGRSQAKDALAQLNTPYNPNNVIGMAQAEQGLADWAASPRNPSNISRELVPYNRGSIEAAYRAGSPATTAATDVVLSQQLGAGQRALPPGVSFARPIPGTGGFTPPPFGGGTPYRGMPVPAQRALNVGREAITSSPLSGMFGRGTAATAANAGRFADSPILKMLNSVKGSGGLAKILPGAVNPATGKLGIGQALKGGLAPSLIGLGASMAIDALPFQDDTIAGDTANTLSDVAKWAGMGAGVGSIFGPMGTLFGGLGGGLWGAGQNIFGGDEKDPEQTTKNAFFDALKTADISDESKSAIVDQYKIMSSLAQTKEEKIAALQQAGQMVMEEAAASRGAANDAETLLASQAMLQKFLEPQLANIRNSARNEQMFMNQLIPSLPKEFQTGARISSSRRLNNADRDALAYGQQVMMQPYMATLELNKNRENQMLQQMWQQGQTGGGTGAIEDMLANGL